jgi:hypothetical protein
MHIFWYYPFPHAAESALALACLREGDRLTVQALRTFEGRLLPGDFSSYDVRRELPEPRAGRSVSSACRGDCVTRWLECSPGTGRFALPGPTSVISTR